MGTSCVSSFKLTRMHDKDVEIKHSKSYDESKMKVHVYQITHSQLDASIKIAYIKEICVKMKWINIEKKINIENGL